MQAPPARRRRRWPIVAITLLLALFAAAAIVLSLPPFGARAAGERLARTQADPHFRDGAFVNDVPPAGYTVADVRALLAGQFLGDEVQGAAVAPAHRARRCTGIAGRARLAGAARVLDRPRQRLRRDRRRAHAGRSGVLRVRVAVRDRSATLPSAADRAGRAAADRRRADHARPLRPSGHGHRAAARRARHGASSCRWASARTCSAGACPKRRSAT